MEPPDHYVERFDEFMRAWLGNAVRYCIVLCRDPELAEEVVQQVFVSMFRTNATPWQAKQPAAYLFRSVRNGLIDFRHAARRLQPIEGLADRLASPAAISHELPESLSRALLALSDDHREVITLRYFETMTLHDIADVMGRSVGAVNKLLARAKDELRQTLSNTGDVEEFDSRQQNARRT